MNSKLWTPGTVLLKSLLWLVRFRKNAGSFVSTWLCLRKFAEWFDTLTTKHWLHTLGIWCPFCFLHSSWAKHLVITHVPWVRHGAQPLIGRVSCLAKTSLFLFSIVETLLQIIFGHLTLNSTFLLTLDLCSTFILTLDLIFDFYLDLVIDFQLFSVAWTKFSTSIWTLVFSPTFKTSFWWSKIEVWGVSVL